MKKSIKKIAWATIVTTAILNVAVVIQSEWNARKDNHSMLSGSIESVSTSESSTWTGECGPIEDIAAGVFRISSVISVSGEYPPKNSNSPNNVSVRPPLAIPESELRGVPFIRYNYKTKGKFVETELKSDEFTLYYKNCTNKQILIPCHIPYEDTKTGRVAGLYKLGSMFNIQLIQGF